MEIYRGEGRIPGESRYRFCGRVRAPQDRQNKFEVHLRRRSISYAVRTAINTRNRKGREREGEITREARQVEDRFRRDGQESARTTDERESAARCLYL
jgi:hypothetical protein